MAPLAQGIDSEDRTCICGLAWWGTTIKTLPPSVNGHKGAALTEKPQLTAKATAGWLSAESGNCPTPGKFLVRARLHSLLTCASVRLNAARRGHYERARMTISSVMLAAAETMRQAAAEIERLREEHDMLAQALRDIDQHQSIVGAEMAGFSVTAQIARRALASLEQAS